MLAIQQTEFGGPEVLQPVELPDPIPQEGEILIDVEHAGINFADVHQRENAYLRGQQLPRIPGLEVAGRCVADGRRVVALTAGSVGGYATRACARAERVFPIPDDLDDTIALALLIQGLTAWHLYASCAHVQSGESVVVISGAGGVGSLAVQLGAQFGARVIATASSAEKRELCLRLGAERALDHGDPDALQADLRAATGGNGPDVIFDVIGAATFDACLRALADGGRIVPYGISSREQNTVMTGRLLKRSQAVIGFWLMHYIERRQFCEPPLARLMELAAAGRIEVQIGGIYPLVEAARAHRDLAARKTTGKLVLKTNGGLG